MLLALVAVGFCADGQKAKEDLGNAVYEASVEAREKDREIANLKAKIDTLEVELFLFETAPPETVTVVETVVETRTVVDSVMYPVETLVMDTVYVPETIFAKPDTVRLACELPLNVGHAWYEPQSSDILLMAGSAALSAVITYFIMDHDHEIRIVRDQEW